MNELIKEKLNEKAMIITTRNQELELVKTLKFTIIKLFVVKKDIGLKNHDKN